MPRRITPVTHWVLDQYPKLVTKLERRRDGEIFVVADGRNIGIENMRLLVPNGLDVYQVNNEPIEGLCSFFSSKQNDLSPAYLSVVIPTQEGGLNFSRSTADLLKSKWFDGRTSSLIFRMMILGDMGSATGFYDHPHPSRDRHPYHDLHEKNGIITGLYKTMQNFEPVTS